MSLSYFFIIILSLLYSYYYFCNLKTIILIIKSIHDQKRLERHNNINTVKNWLFKLVGKQTVQIINEKTKFINISINKKLSKYLFNLY